MDSSSSQTETSTTLLRGIAEGDQCSWVRFVERYRPMIVRRCRELGLSPSDSENLAQEVFLHLFKRIDQFQRQRSGSFRRWLGMLLRSRVIDSYRKKRIPIDSAAQVEFITALMPESVTAISAQNQEIIKQMIATIRSSFKDRDWTIFYLTVGEERPVKEVAEALEISENTVYLCKSRMLRKLKEAYEFKNGQLISKGSARSRE